MTEAYGRKPSDAPAEDVRRDISDVTAVVERFSSSRHDPGWAQLEGVHALKHAVRFGAHIEMVATPDVAMLQRLLHALAPDVALPVATIELPAAAWSAVTGRPLPSPALSLARRPFVDTDAVLSAAGRVVVLEQPRHLGNLGAVIRVATAADAGGVLVIGETDPWHPLAIRAAAGLQFAVPVARTGALPATNRPVVALDAGGEPLTSAALPHDAILLVGTERGGLSPEARAWADSTVAIPMRTGVSSLNLATAVAVALYAR